MRKPIVLLAAVLVLSVTAACHHGFGNQISGSGNRQKQKRDVPEFTSIASEGAFRIQVNAQKPVSLEIEGDDNILPLISTEVSNNVLHIKSSRGYSVSDSITLKISVPNLEGISANGAGNFEIAGLNNDKFEINLNGAPNIKVSGETKQLSIDANGAGKIDAGRLRASRAVVDSKGVSKVEVDAREQLDVTVSGPSTVVYAGDPVVNKTIHGPGSVQRRASTGS